jgi:holo-[acyl-carrier protein] synthase
MIIGIGTDIVSIPRIERAIERFGERFLNKVFTQEEVATCKEPPQLAARFAAKEAALKAIGTGISKGIAFKDIEVRRKSGERPEVRLHGKGKEVAESLGLKAVHLSLSHDGGFAVAFVVIEGSPI